MNIFNINISDAVFRNKFVMILVAIVVIIIVYMLINNPSEATNNNGSSSYNIKADSVVIKNNEKEKEDARGNLDGETVKILKSILKSHQEIIKYDANFAEAANQRMRVGEDYVLTHEISVAGSNKSINDIKIMVRMSLNSKKVIKVAVDNISNYIMDNLKNNINIKEKFFNAKLKELNRLLDDTLLAELSEDENKKLYAQITMIKSSSLYLSYQPKLSYYYYELAVKAYPALSVINELKKEYADISPRDAENLRFATLQLTELPASSKLMNMPAKKIIGLGNAEKIRKKGYDLYLTTLMRTSNRKIRVYVILKYYNDYELEQKKEEILSIIPTAIEINNQKSLPLEYRYRETRKKIYIYHSAHLNSKIDKKFMQEMLQNNISNIEAKGKWNYSNELYTLYYDGESAKLSELNKFVKYSKEILPTFEIKIFAYQQSESRNIRKLFKDQNLKYIFVLEKNAFIKK